MTRLVYGVLLRKLLNETAAKGRKTLKVSHGQLNTLKLEHNDVLNGVRLIEDNREIHRRAQPTTGS